MELIVVQVPFLDPSEEGRRSGTSSQIALCLAAEPTSSGHEVFEVKGGKLSCESAQDFFGWHPPIVFNVA
jgi:hypothetical protein